MTITDRIVAQTTLNGDGSTRVREEHTFHTGDVRHYRYDAETGLDYNLALPVHEIIMLKREKARELGDLRYRLIRNGESPSDFKREHNVAADFVEPILRAFMDITNPVQAVNIAKWIDTKLSDEQIEAVVSLAIREKVRQRIANILVMETTLLLDDDYVVKVPK